jgi:hypothetical protein
VSGLSSYIFCSISIGPRNVVQLFVEYTFGSFDLTLRGIYPHPGFTDLPETEDYEQAAHPAAPRYAALG